jgi:hypothetical protein
MGLSTRQHEPKPGFTRSNHTDGGDPAISPLFNFAGMNIFNVKAKILSANSHGRKYFPAISVGGLLRTNDPSVSQFVAHKKLPMEISIWSIPDGALTSELAPSARP